MLNTCVEIFTPALHLSGKNTSVVNVVCRAGCDAPIGISIEEPQ
jgi:hypothetical protein